MIAYMLRSVSVAALNGRERAGAWEMYRKAVGPNLRLLRLRYLLGFPVTALAERLDLTIPAIGLPKRPSVPIPK